MQTDRLPVRRRRGFVLGAGLALATSIAAAGCSDEGPVRQAVSGTVALDGKPLATGSITFVPVEGATAATAEVVDGAFQTGRSTGPAPGRYQVEIVAVQSTGKTIPHPDFPETTIEEVRNLVPPRYNVKTELKAEVKPDANEPYKFDLSSQTATSPRARRR
ncbi:MAG: hypothetical protein P4L85_16535 [Paludisphaera borealis]|uniref:hypothetical protein n=1 Tax=Paludisphaera borealis TaxID=1387353 RepID=UPI00283DAFF7|nr:hypothetical protein [Paludisphaera borealis]MDR3620961.1 hypothetical protein [Paludisphaera borealis]